MALLEKASSSIPLNLSLRVIRGPFRLGALAWMVVAVIRLVLFAWVGLYATVQWRDRRVPNNLGSGDTIWNSVGERLRGDESPSNRRSLLLIPLIRKLQ